MGDPGLVAGDAIDIADLLGARPEGGEIGAGVGLGEDGGGDDLAGGEPGQPAALLLVGAGGEDELARDLAAGAERADGDPAARQLLRDDAHGFLAEAHAAMLLRQGQREDAEAGELLDQLERHIGIGAVPFMGLGGDAVLDEAAHLAADLVERVVETAIAEGRGALRARSSARRAGCGCRASIPCAINGAAMVFSSAMSASARPRCRGLTNSCWFIGMPPMICSRYSPKRMPAMRRSISVKRLPSDSRPAQAARLFRVSP